MASLRYDKRARAWFADYYLRQPDGTLRRIRKYYPAGLTDEEIRADFAETYSAESLRREEAERKAKAAGKRTRRDPTIAELASWYVDELQVSRGDTERTRDGNRYKLRLFAAWLASQGVERASRLVAAPHLIDSYAAHLRSRYTGNTPRLHMVLIKALFTAAHKRRLIPEPPVTEWPIPRLLEPEGDDTLTSTEFTALMDYFAALRHPMRNAVLYLAYVGCRPSDVCALTWDRIDMAAGVVRFRQQKTQQWITAPLVAPVLAALAEERLLNRPGPLVFRSTRGRRLTRENLSALLAHHSERVIGRVIRAKAFRQFMVTDVIEAGSDIETVRLLTGHRSTAATQYLKRRFDRAREAAEAFAARRTAHARKK